MAHRARPGSRQAAQAHAEERQACPCAEGARAATQGQLELRALVCAGMNAVKSTLAWDPTRVTFARPCTRVPRSRASCR
eukprot:6987619-Prymnesium_polylepis.1